MAAVAPGRVVQRTGAVLGGGQVARVAAAQEEVQVRHAHPGQAVMEGGVALRHHAPVGPVEQFPGLGPQPERVGRPGDAGQAVHEAVRVVRRVDPRQRGAQPVEPLGPDGHAAGVQCPQHATRPGSEAQRVAPPRERVKRERWTRLSLRI
ncbi:MULTISPECIES: hypothetical protein [Streptomyces]|uniref:hypothetical protein n=1 Tax=Streptomyces TaxID=1883 RepID=UPI0006AE112D|nr:hypothetical protein [Streptomyces sp. XY66]